MVKSYRSRRSSSDQLVPYDGTTSYELEFPEGMLPALLKIGAEGRIITDQQSVLNQRQPGLQLHPHVASGALLSLHKDGSG